MLAAVALLGIAGPVQSAVKITDVTTSPAGPVLDDVSTLLSLTTSTGVLFSDEIAAVVDSFNVSGNNGGYFKGGSTGGAYPTNVDEVFNDLDPTTGKANSASVNVLFDTPIQVVDANAPVAAVFEVGDSSQTDSWTFRALLDNNISAPSLGSTYTVNQNVIFGDTGHNISFQRSSDPSPLNQNLMGTVLRASDLGLTAGQTLYGLQFTTDNGDPNLVIGLQIPTPTALPAGLAMMSLLMIKRRCNAA